MRWGTGSWSLRHGVLKSFAWIVLCAVGSLLISACGDAGEPSGSSPPTSPDSRAPDDMSARLDAFEQTTGVRVTTLPDGCEAYGFEGPTDSAERTGTLLVRCSDAELQITRLPDDGTVAASDAPVLPTHVATEAMWRPMPGCILRVRFTSGGDARTVQEVAQGLQVTR